MLLPYDPKEINLESLKELVVILLELYDKLKPNLEKDMENYLKKKLKFYNFLNYARINEKSLYGLIELFRVQTEIDYQIDMLLLSLILEKIVEKELCAQVNSMIGLLAKYERVDELKYQIRKLQTELISKKNGYSKEIIQFSIEERESEMREIEACIKLTDEGVKLLKELNSGKI
ncbi:hypothetical protein BIY23_03645 [Wolbachia pipientis]|uniref:Uncharacterized protein n=1 Tax=Wolbachia pipientis TaxID=955 RepID=A0A1E7QJV2_WOLPI|nr:hypothetical protein BIY23_03645 [Wolbachia pipientis]